MLRVQLQIKALPLHLATGQEHLTDTAGSNMCLAETQIAASLEAQGVGERKLRFKYAHGNMMGF